MRHELLYYLLRYWYIALTCGLILGYISSWLVATVVGGIVSIFIPWYYGVAIGVFIGLGGNWRSNHNLMAYIREHPPHHDGTL